MDSNEVSAELKKEVGLLFMRKVKIAYCLMKISAQNVLSVTGV